MVRSRSRRRSFEACLGFAQAGLGDSEGVLGVVDPRLTRDRSIGELLLSAQLLVGATIFTLGAGDLGASGFAIDPIVRFVDPGEQIAGLEEATGDERRRHLDDLTRDLRNQVTLGARRDGTVRDDLEVKGSGLGDHHANQRCRILSGPFFGGPLQPEQHENHEQRGTENQERLELRSASVAFRQVQTGECGPAFDLGGVSSIEGPTGPCAPRGG